MKTFLRALCAAGLLSWPALAAPPLTTIEDTLYKADGTRFNGIVTISWSSFIASDQSSIAAQTITVMVVNGLLYVRLVPTTTTNPEIFYNVIYNSEGMVQFSETWSVPPSTRPLRLVDVRVPGTTVTGTGTTTTGNGTGNDTNAQGPVPESDVTGLVADLAARPIEGPAYAPGAVAMVDSQGLIDSVVGNPGDCVFVNGSSGPCGGTVPAFMDGDLPSGIVDGSNNSFTLSAVPSPSTSLAMYRNGLLQNQGVDYTLVNSNVVQFATGNVPQPGDTLLANYRTTPNTSNALPANFRLTNRGAAVPPVYPTAQVLCHGSGTAVSASRFANLATCTIPQGSLSAGDRVEIRFDLAHRGKAGGFTFRLQWGATTVLERTAAPGDAQVSGRADGGLDQSGAQVSTESWGTALPLKATVGNAAGTWSRGLVLNFQGSVGAAGDSLMMRNYVVVRLP